MVEVGAGTGRVVGVAWPDAATVAAVDPVWEGVPGPAGADPGRAAGGPGCAGVGPVWLGTEPDRPAADDA